MESINEQFKETIRDRYRMIATSEMVAHYSGIRNAEISDINEKEIYYRAFGYQPVNTKYYSSEIGVPQADLQNYLASAGWVSFIQRRRQTYTEKGIKSLVIFEVFLHPEGFMLTVAYTGNDDYYVPESREEHSLDNGITISMNMALPYNVDWDTCQILQDFDKYIQENEQSQKYTNPKICIISQSRGEYRVRKFAIQSDANEDLFDEHYGEGFTDFHKSLLQKFESQRKGLVLFHGEPGTGKTAYIRALLHSLQKIKKSVLYAPPTLSSQLTDPAVLEFIADWVIEEKRDCILLIEDAEPLLEIRNSGDGRSTGISNLLNMTDGLLNDMLGLTVICTFNTSINKIDSALLRPQRLIARKEFGKLTKEQGEKLCNVLSVSLPNNVTYPISLAEFYSHLTSSQTLYHGQKEERKIGFGK